jgi:uncharacterized protein YjiS (DUF1127 family)
MTMPNIIPSHSTTAPTIRRGIGIFLVRFGRLIHRWVAAAIARHERKAALWALRRLSDRELRDMGLNRGDIGVGLAEAAKSRLQKQQNRALLRERTMAGSFNTSPSAAKERPAATGLSLAFDKLEVCH